MSKDMPGSTAETDPPNEATGHRPYPLLSVLSDNYNKATAFKYYLFVKENFGCKARLEEVTEFLKTQSKEHALVANRISELGTARKLI
ncbi:hypothetical protein AAVH_16733 [Aphelenchoides avenae]|nr:hypothetical protein AAVH_16733 [Aphelenchus avenae]